MYAENVALPAFACQMPLLQRLVDNLQQRVCCCGPILGETEGRTDGHRIVSQTLLRIYHGGSANNESDHHVDRLIIV